MPTEAEELLWKPDERMFKRLCILFGKSGLINKYLKLARRYEAPYHPGGPRLKLKDLVKLIEKHGAKAKVFSRWQVIDMAEEEINGWRWFAKIVMKRHNVIELQIAGYKGTKATGSTMNHIWGEASDLVPGIDPPSPPEILYPQIAYDGDDERLDRMIGDIVEYFNDVKDVIRRDLTDAQTPERSRKVIGR
jgi:hypothetical protein